jgi:hypothetical protein
MVGQLLADGKGGRVTDRLEEAEVQTCEPRYTNRIEGRAPGASGHLIAQPCDPGGTVNAAVVQGKLTFLSGETCPTGRPGGYGSRTEGHRESDGLATGPYGCRVARHGVTRGVIGQESAEAIVPRWIEGRAELGGPAIEFGKAPHGTDPVRGGHHAGRRLASDPGC